jgi:hypothetical protein
MRLENKVDGRTVVLSQNAKTREAVIKNLCVAKSKTTKELVQETGKKGCYEACKSLEKIGVFGSDNEIKYTLWDPITKEVVTKENHDVIASRDAEYMEKLRKKYKKEGVSDQEIEERLTRYHLCNIEVPYKMWWISKDWNILDN